MNKQNKIDLVEGLTGKLSGATCVLLVNYTGLTVSSQQELKRELKKADSAMVVVKNTLLKRAIENAKLGNGKVEDAILTGQTALIISEGDPIAPIQALGTFMKKNSTPQFKVGVIEGSFQDKESLEKISSLPGKDALMGQLLGVLISPQYGLVSTLNTNLNKLVYILKEVSENGR